VPGRVKTRVRAGIVVAHDYLTQRGGAERVVLSMARTFPKAPIVTSVYRRDGTFPEFAAHDVRTTSLQRWPLVASHHRLALPLYARVWSQVHIQADVAICSTSGWAHGARVEGRKVLYVHNTARWLYQSDDYLRRWPTPGRAAFGAAAGPLRRWDGQAGRSADLVLANSRQVQDRVRRCWGVDCDVLYPAHGADPAGEQHPVAGLDRGFVLVVSRLLPYKRLDVVVEAMSALPSMRLVIVGEGPDSSRLRRMAPKNCVFAGRVSDAELRWLYSNSTCLVSAATDDLGLAPLEAMAFGRPVAVIRAGGYLETVVEGETGVFFDSAQPSAVAAALRTASSTPWQPDRISDHALCYSEAAFSAKLTKLTRELTGTSR
jgi:glycosyltransferase involved in cell wall biosynthesis